MRCALIQVLIIQLKRWKRKAGKKGATAQKLNSDITFGLQLQLPDAQGGSSLYGLNAVIIHHGSKSPYALPARLARTPCRALAAPLPSH